MKKLVLIASLYLGVLLGANGAAHANLISNGSFEDTAGSYPVGAAYVTVDASSAISIPGWRVASGSIDWINTYWQASDGTKSLDLAGYYRHGLIIGTTFNTQVGQAYRVRFDMAGNPDQPYAKSLVAVSSADGSYKSYEFSFDQTGHTKAYMGWVTQSFDFVAAADTAEVYFGDITNRFTNGDEAWGAALDNVRVYAVPEPSTVLLLGAGLATLVMLRRKGRRGIQR